MVRLRLKQIQRNYLWGVGALEWKPHLARWVTVCLDKSKGDLGVTCLSTLNKALLCKWSWRFTNERMAFWNQVIKEVWGGTRGMVF